MSARRTVARRRPLLVALLLVAILPRTAGAQRAECNATDVRAQGAMLDGFGARRQWHPLANPLPPIPLERAHDDAWITGFYADQLDVVRLSFLSDPARPADPRSTRLAQQLDSIGREMRKLAPQVDARTRALIPQTWFKITPVAGRYTIGGPGIDVVTTDAPAARQALCWAALRAGEILEAWAQPSYVAAAASLRVLDQQWRNFESRGLSEFPWERAVAGALWLPVRLVSGRSLPCSLPRWGPPGCQLIALHPSVGYSLATFGAGKSPLARLRGESTVAIDLLGAVRYRDEWRSYRGASVIALLTNQPLALGAAIHFAPGLQTGLAVRENDQGRWRQLVGYASLDAYGLLDRLPSRLEDARDRVHDELVRAERAGGAGSGSGGTPP